MPRAMFLETSSSRTAPLTPLRAREASSILSALPFFSDPDQEEGVAILRHSPDDRKARWKASDKLRGSVRGISSKSGWHGSRADRSRAGRYNIDYALLLSGKATRRTARLPVDLMIGGWRPRFDTVGDYLAETSCGQRARWALLHAEGRARYQIGRGLLDAACSLVDHGLINEAEVFYGEGRNSPERLLVRDAVFASEDLTVEDMVGILISAPYEVARLKGEEPPTWDENLDIDDRTPLIFIHCAGVERDLEGCYKVVLEAVDFGSVDTLAACVQVLRRRHHDMMCESQDALASIMDGSLEYRAGRRR